MQLFKANFIALVALCSAAALAGDVPCGGENALEAIEVLEKLQAGDPKLEIDGAYEDLKILLEGDCDSREAALAEADLESFAWELLDDSGQAASGCGTEARKDLKECQGDCKAAGKKLCGCVAAFVIDVAACIL